MSECARILRAQAARLRGEVEDLEDEAIALGNQIAALEKKALEAEKADPNEDVRWAELRAARRDPRQLQFGSSVPPTIHAGRP